MNEEEQAAYNMGLMEGKLETVIKSDRRSHARVDAHDMRLTALERVMWGGFAVFGFIQAKPYISYLVER
jgi:hypothetical protein